MSCGSCERLIERVVTANDAQVKEIDAKSGIAIVTAEEDKIGRIKQQLAEKGFNERNSIQTIRGDSRHVKKYISNVIAGAPEVGIESKLVNYAILSLGGLFLLGGAGLMYGANNGLNTTPFLPLLFLTVAGAVAIVFSYHHMSCYKKGISCTNGMMIGMTIGMISGFMVGALLGATNGMFIGSVAGLVTGISLGGNLGRCCGVMGAMEGIMGGLMAGVMGAMTSVMMINDYLLVFLYILSGICIFVLGGLSYMMYRESGAAPNEGMMVGFWRFFVASAILSGLIALIMIFGPKAGVTYP